MIGQMISAFGADDVAGNRPKFRKLRFQMIADKAVMEEVKAWQSRPLDEVYPIVYMDALRVKVRDGGHIQNKAIHVAMGVNMEGHKEILGTVDGAK